MLSDSPNLRPSLWVMWVVFAQTAFLGWMGGLVGKEPLRPGVLVLTSFSLLVWFPFLWSTGRQKWHELGLWEGRFGCRLTLVQAAAALRSTGSKFAAFLYAGLFFLTALVLGLLVFQGGSGLLTGDGSGALSAIYLAVFLLILVSTASLCVFAEVFRGVHPGAPLVAFAKTPAAVS